MEIRHGWDGVKAAATFGGVREAGPGGGDQDNIGYSPAYNSAFLQSEIKQRH